jgi:hypothetical protein
MANFQAISEDTTWPAIHDVRFIGDDRLCSASYLQDELVTDSIATGKLATDFQQAVNQSDRYNAAAAADSDLVPDSLKWPSAALRDQEATPFVVFVGAVIALPVWDASIGIGAAVAAAYVAASGAYYLQNCNRPAKGAVKLGITQVQTVVPNTVQAEAFIPNRRPLPVVESLGVAQPQIAN